VEFPVLQVYTLLAFNEKQPYVQLHHYLKPKVGYRDHFR